MVEVELGSGAVVELLGLGCYRTLDSWLRSGVLPAPMADPVRRWTFVDILRARVVRDLRAAGVSMQAIRRMVEALEDRFDEVDPLASGRLVLVGDRVFWEVDRDTLLDAVSGQTAISRMLVLDVGKVARELVVDLEAMEREVA